MKISTSLRAVKSIVVVTFICSIFVLIGGTVYWQLGSANGGDMGAGTSVLTPKAVEALP
jgi:hypothetical protein